MIKYTPWPEYREQMFAWFRKKEGKSIDELMDEFIREITGEGDEE